MPTNKTCHEDIGHANKQYCHCQEDTGTQSRQHLPGRCRTCQQTIHVRKMYELQVNKTCHDDIGHAREQDLTGRYWNCKQTRLVSKISDIPTNNTCQEDIGHANKQDLS